MHDVENDLEEQRKPLSATEQRKQQAATAKANRVHIERVTEIADLLLSSGLSGIYDMTYEAIYATTVMWEYKGADGKIYGPFSSQEISVWKSQGYLTGPTSVMMRKVKSSLPFLNQAKSTSSSAGLDSIYDDDDLQADEPVTKKSKIENTDAQGLSDADDWVNSDDIDFGVFVNLDNEALRYGLNSNNSKDEVKTITPSLSNIKPGNTRAAAIAASKDHHKCSIGDVEVEDVSDDEDN